MNTNNQKLVEIAGRPIFNDRLLTVEDTASINFTDYAETERFAKSLRGQFAIIINSGKTNTGITDSIGSYPIYCNPKRQVNRCLEFSASTLLDGAQPTLNKNAFFSFAALGKNVTENSFFKGIARIPGGSVAIFNEAEHPIIRNYFQIPDLLDLEEIKDTNEAIEKFVFLCESYLAAVETDDDRAGVLFSSGIDSALIVALLNRSPAGRNLTGVSVDYSRLFKARYSEYDDAVRNADHLGLNMQRSVCRSSDFYEAVNCILNNHPVIPPTDRALPIQFGSINDIAANPTVYYTGFNADRPFCGHAHWMAMAMKYSRTYNKAAPQISAEDKASILCYPSEARIKVMTELVEMAGFELSDFKHWIERYKAEQLQYVQKYSDLDFLKLIMLLSEVEIGELWTTEHLALEEHYKINFISPFSDIELIKLGFSLPLSAHFQKGRTKSFLHKILQIETGLKLEKRAFPSPMRFWAMRPSNLAMIKNKNLNKYYKRLWLENVARIGKNYIQLHDSLVLALWLERMGLL